MIYFLAVRLSRNLATSKLSEPEEADQVWLDPSPWAFNGDQAAPCDVKFDHRRVLWFRLRRIAYSTRNR